MTPERWQQIDELFQAALAYPAAAREAFLVDACGADDELHAEVLSLLASHQKATQAFRPDDLNNFYLDLIEEVVTPQEPIGNYKILSEIGRGGMGAVYLAERDDQTYQKRVAIKLIKRGMDSDFILGRFLAERQILASFDHPNIARLLDGGSTRDGRPFFVMEYIAGRPLNEYCNEKNLSVSERLNLFRQICSAVQYAHQRLVIHRDLKPSNILVTDEGLPKLLDFGIAKLLSADTRDYQTETLPMMRLMTPEYASPEQLRGDHITTASDIYSLGILLYELLTGQRPYRFKSRSPMEIADLIASSDPPKPSTAVEQQNTAPQLGQLTAPDSTGESENQKIKVTNREKLSRLLSGDLDNIILKAIRKEKERRYVSVEQFAEDLRRYLEGLPVLARQDTWGYRTAKFIQRNRLAVTAAALVFLSLIAGIVATAWQARVARQQKELALTKQAEAEQRFNEVRKLANLVVFDYHDEIMNLPGSTAVREKLIKDMLEYLNDLAQSASGDASLKLELARAYEKISLVQGGSAYTNLGDTALAIENRRKALALRESLVAAAPDDNRLQAGLAKSYGELGALLSETGNPQEALEVYRKSVELAEQVVAEEPHEELYRRVLANNLANDGRMLATQGDWRAALEAHQKALTLYEALLQAHPGSEEDRRSLSAAYQGIAQLLLSTDDPSAALEKQQKAVDLNQNLVSEFPLNTDYKNLLAANYYYLGDVQFYFAKHLAKPSYLEPALASFKRSATLSDELATADPKDVTNRLESARLRLGHVLDEMGKFAAANANYKKVLMAREALYQADSENTWKQWLVIEACARCARSFAQTGDKNKTGEYVQKTLSYIDATAGQTLDADLLTAKATAFTDLAEAYLALAQKPQPSARESWQTAHHYFQQSLDILLEMKNQGTLSSTEDQTIEAIKKQLAKCQAVLAK